MKLFLIAIVSVETSVRITFAYVTLSSLFVAFGTFYFRFREFGHTKAINASFFIREARIAGINAYVLHPGLEANVFLFTNTFKSNIQTSISNKSNQTDLNFFNGH